MEIERGIRDPALAAEVLDLHPGVTLLQYR